MARAVNNYQPAVMVIFGITGDLSKRYLLPALYHLCKDELLPEPFIIIGTSRQKQGLDEFLGQVELCVLEQDKVCDPEVLKRLRGMMELFQLDPTEEKDYHALYSRLDTLEEEQGICLNRLYYLSIPPQLYSGVVSRLGSAGLNGSCRHGNAMTRLLVEKPFGYDLASAKELIAETAKVFTEEQAFRIDHYLAKDTVQNILEFRRKNPELEERWNSQNIQKIEITAYETLGIGSRKFYDGIGALRDIIQSHLWQLLGLIVMELPPSAASRPIHTAKAAALEAIGALPAQEVSKNTTRAQYDGYGDEVGNEGSQTETFAAIRFTLPSDRWQGCEASLATGKNLNEKCTEICLHFSDNTRVHFRIQPQPAVELEGLAAITDFSDKETPLTHTNPDAYERVLIDAIRGDHTLFASSEEILASWRSLQPVLDEWAKGTPPLRYYRRGSQPESLLT